MISVAIMAHKKRARWVPDLQKRLGDCEVVWDRHNDRHETGLRSIQAFDPEASHHLIVQDDAILCRDFRAGAEKIAALAPCNPVALYVGNIGPLASQIAEVEAPSLVEAEGPHWGVAIILPTVHIPDLVAWYQTEDIRNYDRRISRWYGRQGIACWYTTPSLVEHRHSRSLSRRNDDPDGPGRRAVRFIGAGVSAAGIEWPLPMRIS